MGGTLFFALGTFFDGSSRTAKNMQWMKSFFLDLDCGPEKEFPSQVVAIAELRTFCQNNSLPTPTLVNSGRGRLLDIVRTCVPRRLVARSRAPKDVM